MRPARLAVLASAMAVLAVGTPAAAASPPSAPVIKKLSASHISQKEALLTARIKPEGLETTYELWIDPCVPPMECMTHLPMARGAIPATTKELTVSAATAVVFDELGLKPDTTYEYGVVADNADGTVEVHKYFTTR